MVSELFSIVWEGVRHLENSGFKVIGITADGASSNRKFLKCTRKMMSHAHTRQEPLCG